MRFDFAQGRVYVRQSWLNDLIICPERARFKLAKPDMSGPSDATIMGTALHYGIEQVLGGADVSSITDLALQHWEQLKLEPYKTTNLNPAESEGQIRGMAQAFVDSILPNVKLGGDIEYKFEFPMGFMVNEWAVWCEGTMDYVDPDGVIWDWKTSSRTYYAKEKQSQSIQASVYAAALVQQLKVGYPVDFRYGVMIRQETPKAQIVYMTRTLEHHRWLMHIIRPAILTGLRLGVMDSNWIMNDTSALCSPQWCDYWSICKGAFISDSGLSLPIQAKPVKISKEKKPLSLTKTESNSAILDDVNIQLGGYNDNQ